MANIIGSLLIELKAKTDAFEKGMKSAKDLSFSTAGEIVNSLENIGKSLGRLHFGSLDQAGKSLGILSGIAVGTSVAVATSILVVAEETSKKMVEMGHSAEKAGMDIREFGEFAYAAKRSGVDIETFTNAMAKLNKTALSAAEGNQKAEQALKLAGTSSRDSHGNLQTTSTMLEQIIKRYGELTDKTLASGNAQQVFGKGGVSIVPMLKQGTAAIEEYRKQAEMLGLAFGPETLDAAKKFRGTIVEMKAASEGATIQFTAGFVPALNDALGAMIKVEGHKSAMRQFGEEVGEAFKGLAKAAMAAYVGLQQLYQINIKSPINQIQGQFASGAGLYENLIKGSLKAVFQTDPAAKKEIDDLQKRYDDFVLKVNAGNPHTGDKEKDGKSRTTGLDTTGNIIVERIAKLQAQAEAEGRLANAIGDTTSATLLSTAAAEAQRTIDELNAAGKRKGVQVTEEQAQSVRRLTLLLASYKEALGANKQLEDTIQKTIQATRATENLAQAYNDGAEAVKRAEEQNQVAPFAKQVFDLEQTTAALKKMGASDKDLAPLISALADAKRRLDEYISDVHFAALAQQEAASSKWGDQLRFDTEQLKGYADAVKQGTAAVHAFNIEQELQKFRRENPNLPESDYDKRRRELTAKDTTQQRVNTATTGVDLNIQIDSMRRYTDAVLGGTAALREFNVQQQMEKFERENPNLSSAEYATRRRQLEDIANLEAENAAAQRIHSLQRYKDLEDEIKQLQKLREELQLTGQSTKAADRAIRDAQADQASSRAQTGGVGSGLQAGMMQFAASWRGIGVEIAQETENALKRMQSSMSNFFSSAIMGTKSLGKAFADLGIGMLSAIVDALANMLAKWIMTHVVMAAIKAAFHVQEVSQETAATVARTAIHNTGNVAMALSDAGLAAAGAFAYYSASAPEVAPELAALQYAIGLTFAGLASAAGGMEVDRDQLAFVHKNEKILPARTSAGFDRIINSFTTNSQQLQAANVAGSSSQPNLPPITIHVSGAGDPTTVATKAADIAVTRMKRILRTSGVSR